jgi:hypothetical protein
MGYKIAFAPEPCSFFEIRRNADRLGVSVSSIMRMAVMEYLERHPKDKEDEEKKLFKPVTLIYCDDD